MDEVSSVVSFRMAEPYSPSSLSVNLLAPSRDQHFSHSCYEIEYERTSESARLLFVRNRETDSHLVIKVLREYKDTRYSLTTIDERQACQLEALQWNRKFSPDIYIGLGTICEESPHHICISQIINNPTKDLLESGRDYALLMLRLPDDRRLDNLLHEKIDNSYFARILTENVVRLHENLMPLSLPNEEGFRWGSFQQVQHKLWHNLGLFDILLGNFAEYKSYSWLKDALCELLQELEYPKYFEQRLSENRIKRCHGDLKSPNIWIEAYDSGYNSESWKCVRLLDAIDFNPSYSNIDILSDFAMLVVDIQARTELESPLLADFMIKYYLQLTGQENEISKLVLAYYLVEKSIIDAVVSIVYDKMPCLGLAFLKTAELRMIKLLTQTGLQHLIPKELLYRLDIHFIVSQMWPPTLEIPWG